MPQRQDRRRLFICLFVLLLVALLVVPAGAAALAGGATGGGGGGGGGGFSGGGSSGGYGGSGSGSGGPAWLAFLIVGVCFLPWIIIALVPKWRQGAKTRIRKVVRRRAKTAEAAAAAANLDDGYWEPEQLKARVKEAFFPIQLSWEHRSVEESRPFVSDALFERHKLQLDGLEKQNRVNRIQDLQLSEVDIVRIYNVTDDGEDRFVAYIACSARDWVEDVNTGQMVNGNKTSSSDFEQYWSFARHTQYGWVLDEIQQREEADYHLKADIVNEDEGPRIDEAGDGQAPGAKPAAGSPGAGT
jgi:hypothetical protein